MRASMRESHRSLTRCSTQFYSRLAEGARRDRVGRRRRRCARLSAEVSRRRARGRVAWSSPISGRELRHGLWRDLEAFVREEARRGHAAGSAPLRGLFGSGAFRDGASARPRARRRDDPLGKIDRIDVDPSARAGSSRTTRPGSTRTPRRRSSPEKRLQIPLYMLVLRDLVGVEPLGGLYRPLSGERKARGLLRAEGT